MTLNEALVLSYVKRGIGYGYNILNHIRKSRSDEWVEISRAGLYKTLDKLDKNGHVSKTMEQDGNRPPKKVYNITANGEQALEDFLETGFDFTYLTKNNLDSYLVTAVAASPNAEFLRDKLKKRVDSVQGHLDALETEWPEEKGQYPFIVYALYKRRLEILQEELKWLNWILDYVSDMSGDVLHMTWAEVNNS